MQLLSLFGAIFAVIGAYLHSIDGDPLCPLTPIQNCTAFTERVQKLNTIKFINGFLSGDKCYVYAFHRSSFTKAKRACIRAGGMLAWAKDPNHLSSVMDGLLLSTRSSDEYVFWIGLEWIQAQAWHWTCPSGNLEAENLSWAEGEPSYKQGTKEDYAGQVEWNKSSGVIAIFSRKQEINIHFLCEVDMDLLTTTEGTTSMAPTTTVQTYIKTTVTEATPIPRTTSLGSSSNMDLSTTTMGTTSTATTTLQTTTKGTTSTATTTVQTTIKTTVTEATPTPRTTSGSSSKSTPPLTTHRDSSSLGTGTVTSRTNIRSPTTHTATGDKDVSSIATAPLTTMAKVLSPTKFASDNSGIYAIVGGGVLIILIGLVLAAVFVSRRHKKISEREGTKSQVDESEPEGNSMSANDGSSFATVKSMSDTESSTIHMMSLNEHHTVLPRGGTGQQCTQTRTCNCGVCLARNKMWEDDAKSVSPEHSKNTLEDTEMVSFNG